MVSFWWVVRCAVALVYFQVIVILAIISLYLRENVILFADRAELWQYWDMVRPWAVHVMAVDNPNP